MVIAGLGDKVEGKAKEWQGKLTDDESTEMEGKAQQAVGEVKDAADDVADEVRDRTRRPHWWDATHVRGPLRRAPCLRSGRRDARQALGIVGPGK